MAETPTGIVETPPVVAPVVPPVTETVVSSETDVNTPKQVPLAALQEERDRNRELRAQIEALNRIVQTTTGIPTGAPNANGNGTPSAASGQPTPTPTQPTMELPPQGPQISKEDLDKLWMEDPRKAMQTEMSMALNWYDRLNAQVDIQEAHLARTFKDFEQHRLEVRNYLRQLPPAQRSQPGVVELAYYVVRGQNFDKAVASNEAALLEKLRKGESIQGFNTGSVSAPKVTAPTQLSATEAEIALKMGMKPEEYLAHKKS